MNKSSYLIEEYESMLDHLDEVPLCLSKKYDVSSNGNVEESIKDWAQDESLIEQRKSEVDVTNNDTSVEFLSNGRKNLRSSRTKAKNKENNDTCIKSEEVLQIKYNPNKRYFLDKRQDVLNKTLMRSLKRYLTQEFFNEFKFKELSPKEKTKNIGSFLESFVKKLYEHKINQPSIEISLKILKEYVGYVIDADRTKRVLKNRQNNEFNRLYYEVVYKYSHLKISKLFADQTLKFIFEDFVNEGYLDKMIESDKTLSKNKKEYENTIQIFQHSFAIQKYVLLDVKS